MAENVDKHGVYEPHSDSAGRLFESELSAQITALSTAMKAKFASSNLIVAVDSCFADQMFTTVSAALPANVSIAWSTDKTHCQSAKGGHATFWAAGFRAAFQHDDDPATAGEVDPKLQVSVETSFKSAADQSDKGNPTGKSGAGYKPNPQAPAVVLSAPK